MSGLNAVLFVAAMIVLARTMNWCTRETLLALSFPSLIFMYVPYPEALFFFGSSLFLRGYWPSARDAPARADHPGPDGRRPMAREMRSPKLAVAGLFLASLTRSASNVFLPVVIVTEWLADRGSARRACVFGLTTAAGVCLVAVIQHAQAGPWLGFVSAHQPWGAMRSGHGCR